MRARSRDRLRIAPLVLAPFLVASPALADVPAPPDDVRAKADAEFEEAKQLMDAGQTAAACVKFAQSQQLDPKLGRLLNLAYCHEAEGKTASAWREYNDAAALAEQKGQEERMQFAREHAAAVAKHLAFVHLAIPAGAEGVEVDGAGLPRDQWATPLPVDPGEHVVVVSAPGKRARTTTIGIARAAGVQEVVIAALESDRPAPPPAAAPSAPPVAPAPTAPPPAPEAPAESSGTAVPAIVATAIAAGGLGVGIAFGMQASSKKSSADAHCPAKLCDAQGSTLIADARSAATVSTIGFGVALVGAAAATWLFLAPPGKGSASARVTPLVTARAAGLGVEGAW